MRQTLQTGIRTRSRSRSDVDQSRSGLRTTTRRRSMDQSEPKAPKKHREGSSPEGKHRRPAQSPEKGKLTRLTFSYYVFL